MLLHKRQDLANPARKLQDLANPARKPQMQTLFVGHPWCPLTKPTSTRIKLFKYGFWCLLSRFACGLCAGFAKSCFFIKGRI